MHIPAYTGRLRTRRLLDCCQVIVEDVRSAKGRAGDEASELVFFACANQLDADTLAEIFNRFPKHGVVEKLIEIFLSHFFAGRCSSGSMAPSKGFGRTGGHDGP